MTATEFWARVKQTDSCWEWPVLTAKGVGLARHAGRRLSAHRLAWEFSYGPLPAGLNVMQRCGDRACVRPEHLATTRSRRRARAPISERFWRYVEKTETCWLWIGSRVPGGYGGLSSQLRGIPRRAHRISYELAHGPIPEGLDVLHRCDNPPCVRPEHLFLGTARDNAVDMMAKRRSRVAKLTPERVAAVREAVAAGETRKAVAAREGVSLTAVSRVCLRQSWAWLDPHAAPLRCNTRRATR